MHHHKLRKSVIVALGLASCVESADDPGAPTAEAEQAQTAGYYTTCERMADFWDQWYDAGSLWSACARDEMAVGRYIHAGGANYRHHAEWWVAAPINVHYEAIFSFGAQPGGGRVPLWHCRVGPDDFVSSDANCEGRTNNGLAGYSLPGGRPVYRCVVNGNDHMLSWDPNCEGRRRDGLIGYARW